MVKQLKDVRRLIRISVSTYSDCTQTTKIKVLDRQDSEYEIYMAFDRPQPLMNVELRVVKLNKQVVKVIS